jgi:cadmium resistance protein CadD (predicted permease)
MGGFLMEYIIGILGIVCMVIGVLTVLASKDELEKLQKERNELERENLYLRTYLNNLKINMEA